MNTRQVIALSIGIAIACLMLLFPPYWNDSGLIGGDYFIFFRHPPPQGYPWSLNRSLLDEELAVAGLVTLLGLIAFRHRAKRSQVISGSIGLAVIFLLALLMQPWSGSALDWVPWDILGTVAGIMIGVVLVLGFVPRPRQTKETPNPTGSPPMPE